MIIMTKLNSSSLEQLGEIFYAKPEIVSKQIEGNQFITIVFDEKKVENLTEKLKKSGRLIRKLKIEKI